MKNKKSIKKVRQYRKLKRQKKVEVTPSSQIPKDQKVKEYKRVKKITTNTPIKGEIGQIWIRAEARKKTLRKIVEGFSYLADPTYSEHTRQMMITQAIKSAWKHIPFSPDHFAIIERKYVYLVPK